MKFCEKNVGMIDRSVRLGAGIALIVGGLVYFAGLVSYVVALVGLILLVTGITSSCGIYSLLGISTAGKTAASAPKKRRK
ncbi:DUF2892 domain-containing protein [Candidatus Micrarchaeota archaeon]|nr:DUF2892 domain-containing protein [Candidatus Micrarchaeota archaeon]